MAREPSSTSLPAVDPFLKWPGGKRWLAHALSGVRAEVAAGGALVEPFMGGAALFFAGPTTARLSDANLQLVEAFLAVKLDVEGVIRALRRLPEPSAANYDRVAGSRPRSETGKAARLIYLNRLSFNGVWRVNRSGQFNVPYGHRPPADLLQLARLRAASEALRAAEVSHRDFRAALEDVTAGEFVYCDPPYTVAHNNNGFIRYNERLFHWDDQVDLAERLQQLASGGTAVVVTNAAHQDLRRLYPSRHFVCFRVTRSSRVAASPTHRGAREEILLLSRPAIDRVTRIEQLLGDALPRSVTLDRMR